MLFGKHNKEMVLQMKENNQLLANVLNQMSEANAKHNEELVSKNQENNQLLANVLNQMSEANAKHNEELVSKNQENNQLLANVLTQISEVNSKYSDKMILKSQENNELLANVLARIAETNSKYTAEMAQKSQENNQLLANTLTQLAEMQVKQNEKVPEEKVDAWLAAYALNLCTMSITQIIENNDVRYMEQEYDNILNNLNLEVIPKDEALLDVLKQILDVINFFKIQSKEKALLEKEYQQKLKDAVWSAVPSPSVILAGGKGGWLGLAVSAAVSVGTGYMNYRKEKARINNEQERKNWELERSAMEQLHGLQRQLFETAWRLADEYGFEDAYRLSERQIKQYDAILSDENALRRYERFEYIQDKFEAYPPFWYYMGSAALEFANESADDTKVCVEYLVNAQECFDNFFAKSAAGLRVLREDPIVAQCTFEYLSVLNLLEAKGLLLVGEEELAELKQKKIVQLNEARDSSGNACDILQQCALNYMALGVYDDAIKIMVALINEHYNVSINAQFLSLLYVQKLLDGDSLARNRYVVLENKLGKLGEGVILYPLISRESEKAQADAEFIHKLKISSASQYLSVVKKYADDMRLVFLGFWEADYDIAEDIIELLYRMAKDLDGIVSESVYQIVAQNIKNVAGNSKNGISNMLSNKGARNITVLDSLLNGILNDVTMGIIKDIESAKDVNTISRVESKILSFAEKQKIVFDNFSGNVERKVIAQSIEGALLGESAQNRSRNKSQLEEYLQIVDNDGVRSNIYSTKKDFWGRDGRDKAIFITASDRVKFDDYKRRCADDIADEEPKAVPFAVFQYKDDYKEDLVFTTKGLFVISHKRCDCVSYQDVCSVKNGEAFGVGDDDEAFYDRMAINYDQFFAVIAKLVDVERKYSKVITKETVADTKVNYIRLLENKIKLWKKRDLIRS